MNKFLCFPNFKVLLIVLVFSELQSIVDSSCVTYDWNSFITYVLTVFQSVHSFYFVQYSTELRLTVFKAFTVSTLYTTVQN